MYFVLLTVESSRALIKRKAKGKAFCGFINAFRGAGWVLFRSKLHQRCGGLYFRNGLEADAFCDALSLKI